MSRLPALTPRQVVTALKRAGFEGVHQKGSHLFMRSQSTGKTTTVPMHKGDLPRGTLKAIIRQAGFTDDEFSSLL